MRNPIILVALAALLAPQAPAPAPTQIFLAPFVEGPPKNTRVAFLTFQRHGTSIGKPVVKLTTHPMDDDEPAFLPDSKGFLFTSNRDGKQFDVFRYDLASKAVTQITRTPEDERGPVPSAAGRAFTVARGAGRRLWRFNIDGSDAGAVSSHPGGIVSHAWLSETSAAAVVGSSLQLIDSGTGAADTIESGVATALFVRPDRSGIGFTRKVPDGSLVMREWAVATRKAREIGFAAEGAELITCTPGNRLLTAWRSQVFFFEPETDRWLEFADLDNAKVTNITRLAVSPDGKWIALVSQ